MDWTDILLHAVAAISTGAVLYMWGGGFTVWFNTVFWPVREVYQHYPKVQEVITHPQSLLEWVVPVSCAWATYMVMRKYYKLRTYDEGTF